LYDNVRAMTNLLRRTLIALTAALALLGLTFTSTAPAQAAAGHSSKICIYWSSYTYVTAKDIRTGASNNLTQFDADPNETLGECTGYHIAEDWRVDTDPMGDSHSYRTRYDKYIGGSWQIGSWNSCHYNSDNHSSNPNDPSDDTLWRVVYRNYDDGDCTN
jgi:hypothetical protein